jgi:hypothetical protein
MSNKKNNGGPAFPVIAEGGPNSDLGALLQPGMTLRDYFAAMATQGMLSDQQRDGSFLEYAEDAYRFSDAMLKAREHFPSDAE